MGEYKLTEAPRQAVDPLPDDPSPEEIRRHRVDMIRYKVTKRLRWKRRKGLRAEYSDMKEYVVCSDYNVAEGKNVSRFKWNATFLAENPQMAFKVAVHFLSERFKHYPIERRELCMPDRIGIRQENTVLFQFFDLQPIHQDEIRGYAETFANQGKPQPAPEPEQKPVEAESPLSLIHI